MQEPRFYLTQVVFYNLGGDALIPVIYLEENKQCSFVAKNNNGHWEIANLPNDRLYATPDEFKKHLDNELPYNVISMDAWKEKRKK